VSSLLASLEQVQDRGLFSLLFLAQAFGQKQITHPIDFLVIANQIQEVTGEEALRPDKATILGACKIIPLEYTNIGCCCVDLVTPESAALAPKLRDALFAELTTELSDHVVAYRGPHRWVQSFEPVRLLEPQEPFSCLRKEGVYLITGGLGGMGLTLAEHLAKRVRAKLILIGRSPFPAREEWGQWLSGHETDDPISIKIRQLQACEAAGAEVLVLKADVASFAQMQTALAQATTQFGQIHGVIHSAGIADYAGIIDQRSRTMTEEVLAPKVMGTLILDELLGTTPLDFFVCCSSLSSILYRKEFGQVGYCAANEFLDVFANYKSRKDNAFAVSINWDAWQEVGMAVDAKKRWAKRQRAVEDSSVDQEVVSLQDELTPPEGVEAFSRILGARYSQIVVSTRDLFPLLDQGPEALPPAFVNDFEKATTLASKHERPELDNSYVGPRNQTEEIVAHIWQDLLGFAQIGIHDNFFELGGHSLLATQVIARVRAACQVELPLRAFFENPTVAGLAALIPQSHDQPSEQDNFDQLLAELEDLSEEEVQQALAHLQPEKTSEKKSPA
jgi:hypothetical protein